MLNVTEKRNDRDLIISRLINAPIEKVWQAITSKEEMDKWYFKIDSFKPEVDFTFQFTGEGAKGDKYIHHCEIKEVLPMKKLSYSWRYEGIPGDSLVTFELTHEGNKTKLKLTHAGLESFITDSPDFAEGSFAKGWTYLIGKSLPEYLEKIIKYIHIKPR